MMTAFKRHPGEAAAIFDEDARSFVSYGQLRGRVVECAEIFAALPRPAVAMQLCPTSVASVVAYLAALESRLPLMLADPDSRAIGAIIERYRPTCLILPAGALAPEGYEAFARICGGELTVWCRNEVYPVRPHPDLAVLLPTSGSTGNPKIVRLSHGNLQTNAAAIAQYLGLGPGERAVQYLPMHYSYGLSIVNSHLLSGGAVVPTRHSFLQREFWSLFDDAACTSFSGVPYVYETLRRVRINPGDHPSLRTMTQAGGALRPDVVSAFNSIARAKGQRFYVMYGQTEATARIAYVPPDCLDQKLGSIGIAIPGGQLRLQTVDETSCRQLVYEGPNVMLGYATSPEDLALGDVQHGVLATGDLAEVDGDGFFRITGRLARFAKLFGRRIQLADVETHVEGTTGRSAAVVEGHNTLEVFIENAAPDGLAATRASVCQLLAVPPAAVRVHSVAVLPTTSSGKKDYKALAA